MKKLLFILTFLSVFGWASAQSYQFSEYCTFQYFQYMYEPESTLPQSVDISFYYQLPGSNNDLDNLGMSMCSYPGDAFIAEDGKVVLYSAEMTYLDNGTNVSVSIHMFDGSNYGTKTGEFYQIWNTNDGIYYLFSNEYMTNPGHSVDMVFCDQAIWSEGDGSCIYTEWSVSF